VKGHPCDPPLIKGMRRDLHSHVLIFGLHHLLNQSVQLNHAGSRIHRRDTGLSHLTTDRPYCPTPDSSSIQDALDQIQDSRLAIGPCDAYASDLLIRVAEKGVFERTVATRSDRFSGLKDQLAETMRHPDVPGGGELTRL